MNSREVRLPLPKVSIVTVVRNGRDFVRTAVESVLCQSYPNLEYVIKDGCSTDGTLEILARYLDHAKVISSRDRGIYDAMNQGIQATTGDIIAILNSDDLYVSSEVVAHMVRLMEETGADVGWGDLVYVDREHPKHIIRRWKSSPYSPGKFRSGWHPPHPTFFVRRKIYEKYGLFRTDMRIAADYELMLRFIEKNRVSSCYLPEVMVTMRTGGASGGLLDRLSKTRREDRYAWTVNGLPGGFLAAWFLKPLSKIRQFF